MKELPGVWRGLFLLEALVALVALVAADLGALALAAAGEAGEGLAHLLLHGVLVELTGTAAGRRVALLLLHGAVDVHRTGLHDALAAATLAGATGGGTAGPVVRKILSYLLQKYAVPPTGTPPAHLPVEW